MHNSTCAVVSFDVLLGGDNAPKPYAATLGSRAQSAETPEHYDMLLGQDTLSWYCFPQRLFVHAGSGAVADDRCYGVSKLLWK